MKVMITGGERFRVWKERFNIKCNDIKKILCFPITDYVVSDWARDVKKPCRKYMALLFAFSKEIALKGKYELILSYNGWSSMTKVELYAGEILRLWRERRGYNIEEVSYLTGVNKVMLQRIERGLPPKENVKELIEKGTKGFLKKSWWDIDYE